MALVPQSSETNLFKIAVVTPATQDQAAQVETLDINNIQGFDTSAFDVEEFYNEVKGEITEDEMKKWTTAFIQASEEWKQNHEGQELVLYWDGNKDNTYNLGGDDEEIHYMQTSVKDPTSYVATAQTDTIKTTETKETTETEATQETPSAKEAQNEEPQETTKTAKEYLDTLDEAEQNKVKNEILKGFFGDDVINKYNGEGQPLLDPTNDFWKYVEYNPETGSASLTIQGNTYGGQGQDINNEYSFMLALFPSSRGHYNQLNEAHSEILQGQKFQNGGAAVTFSTKIETQETTETPTQETAETPTEKTTQPPNETTQPPNETNDEKNNIATTNIHLQMVNQLLLLKMKTGNQ